MHACTPLRVSKNEEVGEKGEVCLCVWRRRGVCTFKFCDICSLQLECVYFYTASHKQRARLAPLVNVPALYHGRANEILTGRKNEERSEDKGGEGGKMIR